tara:strand:+ start:20686 stop:22323 length:1638 start_codon:yes stop_codon:yes gene_type:complete
MAINLTQQPYGVLAMTGQNTVYTANLTNIVLNETNVKFLCEVYVGRTYPNIATDFPVATLKASPNAAGVGIFDVSPVIEAYVEPTYEGRKPISTADPLNSSTFKGTDFASNTPHNIHQIDRFCTNSTNTLWYLLRFRIEYLNTATGRVELDATHDKKSTGRLVFNGVLGNTNPITYYNNWYYYNLSGIQYEDGSGDYLINGVAGVSNKGRFISNMPEQQYIRANDYGTIAFFNCINWQGYVTAPGLPKNAIPGIALRFYDEANNTLQANYYANIPANGGKDNWTSDKDTAAYWVYFGHGLANMQGRGETWPANATGYEVYASDGTGGTLNPGCGCVQQHASPSWWSYCGGPFQYINQYACEKAHPPYTGGGEEFTPLSRRYRFDIITDDCFGHKPVRLAWLNRLGSWDYYTFTKKSVKTIKSKRKTYQQLAGTWNEAVWRPKDHLGGTKVFDNQATESLSLNTGYMSETDAAWFEELFTSPNVFIVNDFSSNPLTGFNQATYIHKYLEGVVITSASYTKKTRVVDGLITYNLKVNKSKSLNIQRA